MVGAKGFEPSTSWSRTRRASQAALRPEIAVNTGKVSLSYCAYIRNLYNHASEASTAAQRAIQPQRVAPHSVQSPRPAGARA